MCIQLEGGDGKEKNEKKGEPEKVLLLAEGYVPLPNPGLLLFIASEK